MIRVLLGMILPLIAPTALYFAYVLIAHRLRRRKAAPLAEEVAVDESGAVVRSAPWPWLAGIGVALAAVTMAILSEFDRSPPGGTYVPPQLIDGVIVPGHVIPADEPTDG